MVIDPLVSTTVGKCAPVAKAWKNAGDEASVTRVSVNGFRTTFLVPAPAHPVSIALVTFHDQVATGIGDGENGAEGIEMVALGGTATAGAPTASPSTAKDATTRCLLTFISSTPELAGTRLPGKK